jgi:hypothetical protein
MIRAGRNWGTTMDLGGWPRSLGLDQYEATFRANEIDIDVLLELTEIDLERLDLTRSSNIVCNSPE